MSQLAINGGTAVRTKGWPAWPQWADTEATRLRETLESGEWGGYGDAVGQFEAAFARLHAAAHCIAAVNGTLTLVAALQTCGVGPGDEVIVPPYTFIATASAVRLVGATPVFVDVEPDTFNLDVDAAAAAITSRSRAVIPVHFAGLPVDLDALLPLAEKHGLVVIEDAAHAHGSRWNGRPVGALGHAGSFSFQASKNLTAGEGGALITNHDDLKEKLASMVNQGRRTGGAWYEHPHLGNNLRITAWQAAILLAQLERFEAQLQRRMGNARYLRQELQDVAGLEPLAWDERADAHAHHLFILRYQTPAFEGVSREKFVEALRAEGIPCSTGYAYPLYHQPPLRAEYSRITPCPAAEQACREAIWLTQNLLLAEQEDMDDIIKAIIKIRDHLQELH